MVSWTSSNQLINPSILFLWQGALDRGGEGSRTQGVRKSISKLSFWRKDCLRRGGGGAVHSHKCIHITQEMGTAGKKKKIYIFQLYPFLEYVHLSTDVLLYSFVEAVLEALQSHV